jgi:hypothetical protein
LAWSRRLGCLALVVSVWVVSMMIWPYPARASPHVDNGTDTLALISGPTMMPFGGNMKITYSNSLTGPVFGLVYAVVRNSVGQTVGIEVSTLSLGPGQQGSAYLPVGIGPGPGAYAVSFFVVSADESAISATTTVSYLR